MSSHLFRATIRTTWHVANERPGSSMYVVAAARSRSDASVKAMRKVYATWHRSDNLAVVSLEWLGTVEVAR